MTTTAGWDGPSPGRTLRRAFLRRFFDNELTAGSNDLRTSFIWLLASLAAPGHLLPVYRMWEWESIARYRSVEALSIASLSDKAIYLTWSMTAAGLLTAITWNSLMLDRRDALILCGLPVDARRIVRAKLAALAGYVGLVSVAMHALSAVPFGVILATERPFSFLVRGILAHFVASSAACAFVLLSVAGLQGAAIAVAGPRVFRRLSPVLHVTLVAGILFGLTALPAVARAIGPAVAPDVPAGVTWAGLAAPLWFVGTYEVILGTDNDVLAELNRRAMAALAAAATISLVAYPLAYRRVARAAIEGTATARSSRLRLAQRAATCLARRPESRAAAEFFWLSIARVDRLRFVVAATAGLLVGWCVPAALYWGSLGPTSTPPAALLSPSLSALLTLLVGLRIATAIPADLAATWLLVVAPGDASAVRAGVWRATYVAGVVPVVAACLPVFVWSWGPVVALQHTLVLVSAGALATELLLSSHAGMPFARPWRPETLNLGRRWPLFAAAFIAFSAGLGYVEAIALGRPQRYVPFVAALVLATLALRLVLRSRRPPPTLDLDELGAPAVLRLE